MIDYEDQQYLTASEVAERLKISRGTCISNVLPSLHAYYLPGRKNALYRVSDVEQQAQVRVVEKATPPLAFVRKEA